MSVISTTPKTIFWLKYVNFPLQLSQQKTKKKHRHTKRKEKKKMRITKGK